MKLIFDNKLSWELQNYTPFRGLASLNPNPWKIYM